MKLDPKMKAVAKNWRWWSGGGVISIAVALGCATAVDFKTKGDLARVERQNQPTHDHAPNHVHNHAHDHSPKSLKRGIATKPEDGAPHNGGKVRMPISASFDGEPSISISSDSVLQIMVMADADIRSIQGGIEGLDGLSGFVSQSLEFTEIAAGETKIVNVQVPARTGRLVIRVLGRVGAADTETRMMSTSLELRVVNPRDVRAAQSRKSSPDMADPSIVDSTGQAVRPMKASEE